MPDFRCLIGPLSAVQRRRLLAALNHDELDAVDGDWPSWAHAGQLPPGDDWRTWVIMGGRGFGKTRAGAEWLLRQIAATPAPLRIALVGATIDEARRVMVEGESGLLALGSDMVARWMPTRRLLRFSGGSEAVLFSGASPAALRGPQHHLAWCDELAKWTKPGATWDMLQLGLRLGARPRALVTTTPQPGPVLKRILRARDTVLTGGATRANPHLSPDYVAAMHAQYAGTRLERQELGGEYLVDLAGSLWSEALIERCRAEFPSRLREGPGVGESGTMTGPPPTPPASGRGVFVRAVIGVDPPTGDGTCGIIACAIDADHMAWVLGDHSVTGVSPEGWARAVASAAAAHGTREIIAEDNQGGAMVGAVLRVADPALIIRPVRAATSKSDRATPVAHRFEAGQVRVCGHFPELEAQLCGMVMGGGYAGPGRSPDRADAMVWALTALFDGVGREVRILSL